MQENSKLAIIQENLGLVVVLPLPVRSKIIQIKNWQNLTYADTQKPIYQNKLKFAEKHGNLAILLGPPSGNLVTIDCDNAEVLDRMLMKFPILYKTLRVYGARGAQIWFKMKEGDYEPRCRKWIVNAEDKYSVEFRGGGGYSLISGIHPDEVTYRQKWDGLLTLSSEQVNIIKEWVKSEYSNGVDDEVEPDEIDLSWTKDFSGINLKELDIVGLLKEARLNPIASGRLRDGEIVYDMICPWQENHNKETKKEDTGIIISKGDQWPNFKCFHASCEGKHIGDVLQWVKTSYPGLVEKYSPQPEIPEQERRFSNRFSNLELVSLNSMLEKQEVKIPPELICDVLHKGLKMMIAGRSKSMKSWLCKCLALSLATGTRWLGFIIPTKFKVLYLNLEIPDWSIEKRMRSITRNMNIHRSGNLDFLHLRGVQLHDEKTDIWGEFIRQIKLLGEWDCIIIDPVYKLAVERDENTARGASSICFDMDRMAEVTGAAIIYVHHFAKGLEALKEMQDRMSGSGVWLRDPDVYMCLSRHKEERCFSVEWEIRNNPPVSNFVIEWNGSSHLHIVRDDLNWKDLKQRIKMDEKQRLEIEDNKLRAFVALIPKQGITSSVWERAFGMSRNCFNDWRIKAMNQGLVIKNEDGKYLNTCLR